ncbi:COX15/CtaA family protein [uncultured Paludibaculum sp.]|uniref:COX15/CtaA family protein n=1 Tax=uncultured Paludibaculum sp. TaxID=1765020 RepID=UPI002AABF70E|nr:COX15/CtaA family protein [uncultured Paludibaculum sp.]
MNNRVQAFVRLAWAMLGWNVFVVLWGAFVRASGSGAGCGSHWPLCNGEVMPPSPTMSTIIEFTHRLTSGVALIGVAALVVWSRKLFPKGHLARKAAWASLIFIIVEALLGAGLVLLAYVEKNASAGRALYLCAHLTNTLLLLGAIAWCGWSATHDRWSRLRVPALLWTAMGVALCASITGVVAALGDTIWPAVSLREGMRQEFSKEAPLLLQLRLVHPVIASASGAFLILAALLKFAGRTKSWLLGLTVVQLAAGGLNVVLLAPVWMQILHLALAVGVWIVLCFGVLSRGTETATLPGGRATPGTAGATPLRGVRS